VHEVANLKIFPGDPLSPFILHVPHSSRYIPTEIRQDILLSNEALEHELDEMTDSHTEVLAEHAANRSQIRPWIFLNTYSRLVVDPERFPDDREDMNAIGMGAVYRTTSNGEPLRNPDEIKEKDLLTRYFHPYAQIFEDFLTKRLNQVGDVAIVDVHSYRAIAHKNSLNEGLERPPICIGVDDFHTPSWLQERATRIFGVVGEVAINQPYSGTYVPLSRYRRDKNVSSIMMENRADVFVNEKLEFTDGIEKLAKALAEVIDAGVNP